jgi:hypothetical protein
MDLTTVFISYARQDARRAERLYMDLRAQDIDAWLDTKCLLGGQNWRKEIRKVIRNSAFFIALLSKHSLSKRGMVQTEMKVALTMLSEVPNDQIFLIPVRLEECVPADEELQDINWIDLYPNYLEGFSRILSVVDKVAKVPLEMRVLDSTNSARAPISYAPYRNFIDFAKDLIERLPRSSAFADRDYEMFIRYRTDAPGVVCPNSLREKYPHEINVVLQNQFSALTALDKYFTVVLWFDGKAETLCIPYTSVLEIVIPTIGLRVEHFGLTL